LAVREEDAEDTLAEAIFGKGRFFGARAGAFLLTLLALGVAPVSAQDTPVSPKLALLAFFLDSTETQEAGTGLLGVTISQRQTRDGKEWEVPAVSYTYGLTRRVDVSLSVPYTRSDYGEDYRISGIGDCFLSLKLRVRDAEGTRLGVAFEPTLEILGEGSLSAGELGPGKHNLALPVIVQRGFGPVSVFGEAGYITRGAVFAGVGLDTALMPKVGLGVNLVYSRATSDSALNQEYGLLKSRADATVGVYYIASPRLAFLVSAGRTLTEIDANGTRRIVNVGVTYRWPARRQRRRR
jgi:hypothetical protein